MKPQWEEFCVICGGPTWSGKLQNPAGLNNAGSFSTAWLNDWQGVTPEKPDTPINIGTYDYHGCFELRRKSSKRGKSNKSSKLARILQFQEPLKFATFCEWFSYIAPHEEEHDELHGPPGSCDCSLHESDSSDNDGYDDYDDEWAPCPASAPKPGLHWLQGWWGSDSDWVRYGVAFHRACGQLLQQRLGYAINFNHIWPLLKQQVNQGGGCTNHLSKPAIRGYGGAEQYHSKGYDEKHGASFMFAHVTPQHEHLLLNPLECSSNADRIVRVWKPLVRRFATTGKLVQPQPTQNSPRTAGRSGSAAAAAGGKQGHTGRAGRGEGARPGSVKGARPGSSAHIIRGAAAPVRFEGIEDEGRYSTILQLLVSHASTKQQQLHLTARLLPLCSTMPATLTGRLQLAIKANTARRAAQVAAWLIKYGCVVLTLDLDAVVDCCAQDARAANTVLSQAISTGAGGKALKLTSFKCHAPGRSDVDQLLQSLPLHSLTSLTFNGRWSLSAGSAAALTAATALQELNLPGSGLAGGLSAEGPGSMLTSADSESQGPGAASLASVFSVSLQRLSLTDAGYIRAADLTSLTQQLTAVTRLELTYHLPVDEETEAPGAYSGISNTRRIKRKVQQCWGELPALRSLRLAPRKVPRQSEDIFEDEFPPERQYMGLDRTLLDSIAVLTSLTSLQLGPSAELVGANEADSGLQLLLRPLKGLTGLRKLGLTMQVLGGEDPRLDRRHLRVMNAVAALPELAELALCDAACEGRVIQLVHATKLTRLDFVHGDALAAGTMINLKALHDQRPGVKVQTAWPRPFWDTKH